MSDDQLTPVPASFLALHGPAPTSASAARQPRSRASMGEVRARYELCEDLAGHLVGSAQALLHDDGLAEEDVLIRCHAGLSEPASGFSEAEAAWVVQRLAELLRWHCPPLSPQDGDPPPSASEGFA